jgi:uncharacterized protein (TIGR03067 family)
MNRTLLTLIAFALPLFAAPVPKALMKSDDATAIVGTWRMKDHAMDGRRSESGDVCWRFEPDGKLFCVHDCGTESDMGYSLDPTGDPKRMDWRPTNEAVSWPAIYKLDGDTLFVVTVMSADAPRPTEFAAAKGVYYTEFRREVAK